MSAASTFQWDRKPQSGDLNDVDNGFHYRMIWRSRPQWLFLAALLCHWLTGNYDRASAQDPVEKPNPVVTANDGKRSLTSPNFYDRLQEVTIRDLPSDTTSVPLNLHGRVLDESGKPIPDAVVVLTSYQYRDIDWETYTPKGSNVFARTHTNALGEYAFSDVRCPVRAEESRKSRASSTHLISADSTGRMNWAEVNTVAPRPETVPSTLDITLRNSPELTGVVVDPQEKPVPNVNVRLVALIQFENEHYVRGLDLCPELRLEVVTDEAGQFRLPQIVGRLIARLEMQHADYFQTAGMIRTSDDTSPPNPSMVSMPLDPLQTSPATFHLDQRLMLHGKVVNRKAEPLAGVLVRNIDPSNIQTRSDELGNFTIPISNGWLVRNLGGVDARLAPLSLDWPNGAAFLTSRPVIPKAQIAAGADVIIVAEDAIVLHGKVLASDDLQPIASLPIKIDALTRRPYPFQSGIETQTDNEGRFSITAWQGKWLLSLGPKAGFDLPPTTRRSNDDDGVNPQSQRIIDFVADGTQLNMTIMVDRTPGVDVHVVDSNGQAMPGSLVRFFKTGSIASQNRGKLLDQDLVPDCVTDHAGNCTVSLPTLYNEDWVVTGSSPAESPQLFGRTQIRFVSKQIEVELTPGNLISGSVLLDGMPLAGAGVRLVEGMNIREPRISDTKTDASGIYKLFIPVIKDPRLSALQFSVHLISFPEFTDCQKSIAPLEFNRPSGVKQELNVMRPFQVYSANGTATGVVVDQDGKPVMGATVRAKIYGSPYNRVGTPNLVGDPTKQGIATTDATGAFQWIGLGKGKYKPVITINGKEQSPDVSIEAGQEAVKIEVSRT